MGDMLHARLDEIHNTGCLNDDPRKAGSCIGNNQQNNWWAKTFGNLASQGNMDDNFGYDANTYGLVLGYDRPVAENTRAGVNVGYANSTIDGNDSSGETTIDSYQVTGYLNYTPGPWYVQGALTAGVDRYDGERQIAFADVNRVAKSDYDGKQYSALVSAGKHFYFEKNVTVTPFASLQASRIKVENFNERGAGALNHSVDDQDYDLTRSGLGVKMERSIRSGAFTYAPEVHFKWLHDFSDTTTEQTAALNGGGSAFNVKGIEQDRNLYNIGAGVTVLSCNCDSDSWTVKGQYDYKWNESEYKSNQFSLIASLQF